MLLGFGLVLDMIYSTQDCVNYQIEINYYKSYKMEREGLENLGIEITPNRYGKLNGHNHGREEGGN